MMFASGQMRNITPRQTAGAAGPKSVRKVMTGRIRGWYPTADKPKRRREEARRRFGRDDRCGGEEGPPDRPGGCEVSAGGAPPRPSARTGPCGPAREEQQLVDLAERPVHVGDRDPAQEGGQVGRLVRRESLHLQQAVGGACQQVIRRGPRRIRDRRRRRRGRAHGARNGRRSRPRAAAATKRGEVIARVPVNLAVPARPCRTCPSDR